MFGSNDLYHALRDESVCQKYGYDTATIACMFVPTQKQCDMPSLFCTTWNCIKSQNPIEICLDGVL